MDIKDFKEILDMAVKKAGSCYALAKKTGVPSSMLHLFYSGKRDVKNMTIGTMIKIFPALEKNAFAEIPGKTENSLEIDDKLSSIMAEDWKSLDEVEKAEAVLAIKRIIKQRPLASAGGGEQSDDQLGVAEPQTAYIAKKKKEKKADGNS